MFFINSPLEQFEVINFLGLDIPFIINGGIYLTNYSFHILLVLTSIAFLQLKYVKSYKVIPSKLSLVYESIFQTAETLTTSQIGTRYQQYLPLIYSLFAFILFANYIGMVPYSFAITSHFVTTMGLSFTILLAVTIIGFQKHGVKYFQFLVPGGTPLGILPMIVLIEFVSYIAKGLSLGIRLAGNIMAGHLMLHIVAGFIYKFMVSGIISFILSPLPIIVLVAFMGLELGIAYIQAYVFAILTAIYIHDAIELH